MFFFFSVAGVLPMPFLPAKVMLPFRFAMFEIWLSGTPLARNAVNALVGIVIPLLAVRVEWAVLAGSTSRARTA